MANDLDPRAIADLARSGLASTDILAESVHAKFGESPGYLIPYFNAKGERDTRMYRVKLYTPQPDRKYDQPSSEELPDAKAPYFAPPSTYDYSKLSERKLIVEGEKKAVAAIKFLGLASIGIGGCCNWTGIDVTRGEFPKAAKTLHPAIKEWVKRADTKHVEVVFDADVMTNENVTVAASGLWWILREHGVEATFVILPPETKGLDDWIMAQPDGSARTSFDLLKRISGADLPHTAVSEALHSLGIAFNIRTGLPTVNERTVRRLLTRHPKFQGRLWVDMVKHRCMMDDEPFSDPNTLGWLIEVQELMPTLSNGVCYQALVRIAWERPRNPITEWLGTLEWDGKPRLATFAARYLKLEATPYLDRVFPNFLVGAIARMHTPGTKFDHMLVLQGKQGIGKTSLLRELFGKDHATIAPHTTAIGSRDWLDSGGSGWCLILDELAGLSRVEHTDLKTALSTEQDTYRRAYRRDPETFPRMFVAAATTNEETYLTDPTGNRRYWGVVCEKINVARLVEEREQVWAEAMTLYRAGFDFWHLPPDAQAEAEQRQEEAHIPDHTEEQVENVLSRAFAETEEARPPVVMLNGRPCYFVGSLALMRAVSGDDHADAKHSGLSKRVRNAMTRNPHWRSAKPHINGVQRRGYSLSCEDADMEPRTVFPTSWEAEFGRGSKY